MKYEDWLKEWLKNYIEPTVKARMFKRVYRRQNQVTKDTGKAVRCFSIQEKKKIGQHGIEL